MYRYKSARSKHLIRARYINAASKKVYHAYKTSHKQLAITRPPDFVPLEMTKVCGNAGFHNGRWSGGDSTVRLLLGHNGGSIPAEHSSNRDAEVIEQAEPSIFMHSNNMKRLGMSNDTFFPAIPAGETNPAAVTA